MDRPLTVGYKTSMSGPLRFHLLALADVRMPSWGHDGLARPYWRIYRNADPGWRVEWAGGRSDLTPDRLLLIAPETVYRGVATRPARHFFQHFTIDGVPTVAPGMHAFACTGEIAALLTRIENAAEGPARGLAAASLGLAALSRLPSAALAPATRSPGVAAAIGLAAARSPMPVAVRDLARAAGMHPTAFIRRFRVETGLTPHAWQVRARIEQACLALERGDEAIEAIAERFGFCDRNHFTRVFARLRGIGPGAYRRQTVLTDRAGLAQHGRPEMRDS